MIRKLWSRESGQDLAEYCLLTALIALIGLGIIIHLSGGLQGLWSTANNTLAAGSTQPGATSTGAATSQADH